MIERIIFLGLLPLITSSLFGGELENKLLEAKNDEESVRQKIAKSNTESIKESGLDLLLIKKLDQTEFIVKK